jgi:hypothetical protein
MSLAFCVYDLIIDVDGALDTFARIVDFLGLSGKRVRVRAEKKRLPRIRLDQLESLNQLFSEVKSFSFEVVSGEPLETTLHNEGQYVSYTRVVERDTLMVFSPERTDFFDFAERFMGGAPGKYGFGMNWTKPGSFYGYCKGFEDFRSMGNKIDGESDAGRWGELFLPWRSTLFERPIIRDIYPVNLLTNAHLDRKADDGTVRDLIGGHKEWGGITKLVDDWFMWCVPASEIDAARDAFESRGLLKNNREGFLHQIIT